MEAEQTPPSEGGELDQVPPFAAEAESNQPWEQIAVGRFMPRRIRGSYRGRALG